MWRNLLVTNVNNLAIISHVRRVFGYARPSDYIMGAGVTVVSPLLFGIMERVQPAASGAINYTRCMRLAGAVGLAAGIITVYQRSSSQLFPIHESDSAVGFYIDPVTDSNPLVDRFYGLTENSREEEMDMREMVDKIKKGEPLYGTSVLSPYMQGVAARNSRYTSLFIHVIPWFNVVNHNQVGTISISDRIL